MHVSLDEAIVSTVSGSGREAGVWADASCLSWLARPPHLVHTVRDAMSGALAWEAGSDGLHKTTLMVNQMNRFF